MRYKRNFNRRNRTKKYEFDSISFKEIGDELYRSSTCLAAYAYKPHKFKRYDYSSEYLNETAFNVSKSSNSKSPMLMFKFNVDSHTLVRSNGSVLFRKHKMNGKLIHDELIESFYESIFSSINDYLYEATSNLVDVDSILIEFDSFKLMPKAIESFEYDVIFYDMSIHVFKDSDMKTKLSHYHFNELKFETNSGSNYRMMSKPKYTNHSKYLVLTDRLKIMHSIILNYLVNKYYRTSDFKITSKYMFRHLIDEIYDFMVANKTLVTFKPHKTLIKIVTASLIHQLTYEEMFRLSKLVLHNRNLDRSILNKFSIAEKLHETQLIEIRNIASFSNAIITDQELYECKPIKRLMLTNSDDQSVSALINYDMIYVNDEYLTLDKVSNHHSCIERDIF